MVTDPRDAVVEAAKLILRLHECCVCGDVLMPYSTLPHCDMPRCFPVDGEDEEDSPDRLVESLRAALRALDAAGAELDVTAPGPKPLGAVARLVTSLQDDRDRLRAELASMTSERDNLAEAVKEWCDAHTIVTRDLVAADRRARRWRYVAATLRRRLRNLADVNVAVVGQLAAERARAEKAVVLDGET